MISQFFIVNKSGGMIYSYLADSGVETNQLLVLASMISSINEIGCSLFKPGSYHHEIIMNKQEIHIYRTLTGMLFVFVATKMPSNLFLLVYKHYCEYVLCNPLYQLEMPISCSKFNPKQFFQL